MDLAYVLMIEDASAMDSKLEIREKVDAALRGEVVDHGDGETKAPEPEPDPETWGATPEAIAGQEAAMAALQRGR